MNAGEQHLYHIVSRLREASIHFSLQVTRDDALTIQAVVPGERWEIDVYEDGTVNWEVFRSNGSLGHLEQLNAAIEFFRAQDS